jgi:hypothetical protein
MADPFPEKFLKVSESTVVGEKNGKVHNKMMYNQEWKGPIFDVYSSISSMAVGFVVRKSLTFIVERQDYSIAMVAIDPKGSPADSLTVEGHWLEHRPTWDNKT